MAESMLKQLSLETGIAEEKLEPIVNRIMGYFSQRSTDYLTVEKLFPELNDGDKCDICQSPKPQHNSLTYFINPLHIARIRKYKEQVFTILSETEPSQYSLATGASPSVPNIKDMIHILDRYVGAKLSPNTPAYVYMWLSIFAWMVPSEMFKEQFHNVARALEKAVNYYNTKSGRLLFEWRYRHAANLESLAKAHENEGRILLLMVRETFQEVENQLFGLRLAAKKIGQAPRPLSMRVEEGLAKKAERREEPAKRVKSPEAEE